MKTSITPGAPGDKAATNAALPALRTEIAAYQRRLWAEQRQSILVVLQGLDTAGKDGTIRHVLRGVNPQGVRVTSFGIPTSEELRHDFLWRIHKWAPAAGFIGVFNRSHYEDVVVVRVRGLVSPQDCKRRYDLINGFEDLLAHRGTRVVKFFLHISKQEQRERLQARLDDPAKRWKFNPADLDDRMRWDDHLDAYQDAIAATSTKRAPWYVIPADRKWYRNWAIASILLETLKDLDPQFPDPGPFESISVV